ncbi:hypothetical protein J2Z83_003944 [Virgibacillus natechei]|uniref:Uncharacterized protein n=1 Tax=Virgibacillus natechei TaxID=1216297 RepID=A0ABS4ILI5_9BACI|nr:hypothetical protein [Virgibacillus natechei]
MISDLPEPVVPATKVNHINQYQKLFKQGEASEAMPHLFLISDEFAELKSEQPDFMKETCFYCQNRAFTRYSPYPGNTKACILKNMLAVQSFRNLKGGH